MNTSTLKLMCIIPLCTFTWGCSKDNNGTDVFAETDNLANRTYEWKITLPYADQSEINSSFLSENIHTDREYDSLVHFMDIQFTGNHTVNFVEKFVAHYSSAYRYIGNSDTPVFILHPEEWQRFDTSYFVEKEKNTAARYSGNAPNINFTLIGIYINVYSGPKPNYDYKHIQWNNDFAYTGTFHSENMLECHFPVEWNGDVDTLTRQFSLMPF